MKTYNVRISFDVAVEERSPEDVEEFVLTLLEEGLIRPIIEVEEV